MLLLVRRAVCRPSKLLRPNWLAAVILPPSDTLKSTGRTPPQLSGWICNKTGHLAVPYCSSGMAPDYNDTMRMQGDP